MLAAIIVALIGVVFVVLGYLLGKKEYISLLHSYHYDKVKEEDKKAFCAISGLGIGSTGVGMVVTGLLLTIIESAWCFVAFAIGFVVGLGMLIYAGLRYNR